MVKNRKSVPVTCDYGFTAGYCDLWLHRGCALGRTDTASALGRCNNLTSTEGKVR